MLVNLPVSPIAPSQVPGQGQNIFNLTQPQPNQGMSPQPQGQPQGPQTQVNSVPMIPLAPPVTAGTDCLLRPNKIYNLSKSIQAKTKQKQLQADSNSLERSLIN